MIFGVIQVTCQRPERRPAQAVMTPSKSRSKVTVYWPWRICRRRRLAMCNSSKNNSERFGGDHHFSGPRWAKG